MSKHYSNYAKHQILEKKIIKKKNNHDNIYICVFLFCQKKKNYVKFEIF